MTDYERIAALAQQMELARKDLEVRPEGLRFNAGDALTEHGSPSSRAIEADGAVEGGQ